MPTQAERELYQEYLKLMLENDLPQRSLEDWLATFRQTQVRNNQQPSSQDLPQPPTIEIVTSQELTQYAEYVTFVMTSGLKPRPLEEWVKPVRLARPLILQESPTPTVSDSEETCNKKGSAKTCEMCGCPAKPGLKYCCDCEKKILKQLGETGYLERGGYGYGGSRDWDSKENTYETKYGIDR